MNLFLRNIEKQWLYHVQTGGNKGMHRLPVACGMRNLRIRLALNILWFHYLGKYCIYWLFLFVFAVLLSFVHSDFYHLYVVHFFLFLFRFPAIFCCRLALSLISSCLCNYNYCVGLFCFRHQVGLPCLFFYIKMIQVKIVDIMSTFLSVSYIASSSPYKVIQLLLSELTFWSPLMLIIMYY